LTREHRTEEWLKQSDYDMETARFMFEGGRYFYSVFMCHLSIEKALKGLYYEKMKEVPPKVHNLVYLLNKIGIKPVEDLGRFVIKLNEANIVTRYPEDIEKLKSDYRRISCRTCSRRAGRSFSG
jgi:HEPN domain-containing protein